VLPAEEEIMTTSRKPFIAALAAVLAGALLAGGALPASAHTGIFDVRTKDADPGGEAHLYHKDGWVELRACDIQRDGYGVRAVAGFGPGGSSVASVIAKDTNGAKNGCGKPTVVLPGRGPKVTVKVCLQDRDGDRAGRKNADKCRFTKRKSVRV
jgi:hypothetical protein